MKTLDNGWVRYWEERTEKDDDYYGKKGSNADDIIKFLQIKGKDNVLDIGCANGSHLTDIERKTNAKCYGIDISPIAIKLNKNKKIKLKLGDMEDTKYESGFFDKVFSLGVMEHTPRTEKTFKELNRIMKTKGLSYITVPNLYSFNHIIKNIKMFFGKWELGYERSFSKGQAKRLLKKTGFKLEEFWIEPHRKTAHIFNWADNSLNKVNNRFFGFFINMVIRKEREI